NFIMYADQDKSDDKGRTSVRAAKQTEPRGVVSLRRRPDRDRHRGERRTSEGDGPSRSRRRARGRRRRKSILRSIVLHPPEGVGALGGGGQEGRDPHDAHRQNG